MRYILVNQHIGPLFKAVVNDFAERGLDCVAMAGWIDPEGKALAPGVICWKGITYDRSSTWRRVFTWFFFGLQTWWKLRFCDPRQTRVLYVSNPPFNPLLANLFKHPYAILVYDLYPEILVHKGLISAGSPIFKWWQKQNSRAMERAEIVFTLSENMRKAMKPYFKHEEDWQCKTRVIANWADSQDIYPVKREANPFVQEENLGDKFTILYSGNMGDTHPLEAVVALAVKLSDQEDIQFLMIGDGAKRKSLEQIAKAAALKNLRFLPFQSFEKLKYTLSAADLNIVTLDESAAAASVPSKSYYALAAGSALLGICSEQSEVAQLLETHHIGGRFGPAEIDAMAEFVINLKANPDLLNKYKYNALQAARLYTPENAKRYFEFWRENQKPVN